MITKIPTDVLTSNIIPFLDLEECLEFCKEFKIELKLSVYFRNWKIMPTSQQIVDLNEERLDIFDYVLTNHQLRVFGIGNNVMVKTICKKGYINILKSVTNRCKFSINELNNLRSIALQTRQITIFRHLYELNKPHIHDFTIRFVCSKGWIEFVEYFHEIGKRFNNIYEIKTIEIIKFLIKHRYKIPPAVITNAIRRRNMKVIRYLLSIGIQFNNHDLDVAMRYKNMTITKLVYEHINQICCMLCIIVACKHKNLDGLQFLYTNDPTSKYWEMAIVQATRWSSIEIVDYLYNKSSQFAIETALQTAIKNENREMIKYFCERGVYFKKPTTENRSLKRLLERYKPDDYDLRRSNRLRLKRMKKN